MKFERGAVPFLLIAVVALVIGAGVYSSYRNREIIVNSFEECVAVGHPVMESYPRKCVLPGGKTFTEVLTGDAACAAVSCLTGSSCVNGACVPNEEVIIDSNDPCMRVRCMAGYYCESGTGACMEDQCPTMLCPINTTCLQSQCVPK